ncbi:asparagine synthetase domain-containing protein CG17486 isoform X2 [Venturia canescens]|nr:asparagine synthetase domain-containing protein CG17486 isoform X2 [Venturia canescens]XP_043281253.1 asparagine synthetase domain-containing protein CG17486 isoform X2 [Venturia canescens]XP_043281263.1 asparagine synthetase domain-containing protein CG17486 isoform X2 [Venturia canescens]
MIKQRGPDYLGEKLENLSDQWRGFFATSILWTQGPQLFKQPCIDTDGNILMWNGDIFSGELARSDVADTEVLRNELNTSQNVLETLKKIKGPYSIVYYQKNEKILYFARDRIGRHSLLLKASLKYKWITLSSLANGKFNEFIEVPAIGIFAFKIEDSTLMIYPWSSLETRSENLIQCMEARLGVKIVVLGSLCSSKKEIPLVEPDCQGIDFINGLVSSANADFEILTITKKNVATLQPENLFKFMKSLSDVPEIRTKIERTLELLKKSIQLRVEKKPKFCQNCIRFRFHDENLICNHSKIGILFSGGLDSTLLAALADEFVPKDESIDLVNVAFEKSRNIDTKTPAPKPCNINGEGKFDVPDRKTGRQALAELQKIFPRRTWNFIECNVTQEELQQHRSSRIRSLIHPGATILDESLGCALWFASRASGILASTGKHYDSPSRILLLGMGADELFGGYTRHRTILRRDGWPAVSQELSLELARISERNLGRDDRVVADHGRQSRLPYLDEEFVEYVSSLSPWERCCPIEAMPAGLGDKLLLRLVAHEIGLRETANFPKRAFQFGSRIANPKENAADVSKRLCLEES